jgi:hypothetical protein
MSIEERKKRRHKGREGGRKDRDRKKEGRKEREKERKKKEGRKKEKKRKEGKQKKINQVLVVHTCNPSYSGGRDQEDGSLKPAWEIVCKTLS